MKLYPNKFTLRLCMFVCERSVCHDDIVCEVVCMVNDVLNKLLGNEYCDNK